MAQIDTHLRIAFSDALTLEAQQLDNRLGGTVTQETLEGERKYFDGYGSVAMTERTSRAQANNPQEITRDRRMIQPRWFEYTELFDGKRDTARLMRSIEPNGPYSKAIAGAYHRKVDNTLVEALNATSYGGVDGTTSFNLGAANFVDNATPGIMTVDKLRAARLLLKGVDAIEPGEGAILALHPDQMDDLLADTEVTSSDYVNVKALVQGEVDTFLGFMFVQSTQIVDHTTNERYAWAYTPDAMILGQEGALDVHIDDLPQQGHSTQFAAYATVAAVRRYENKVVRINNNST